MNETQTRKLCKRGFVTCHLRLKVKDRVAFFDAHNGPSETSVCTNEIGKCGCIHAEARAVEKANNYAKKNYLKGLRNLDIESIFVGVSMSPCPVCAELLELAFKKAKKKELYYLERYRNEEGLKYLEANGWVLEEEIK